MRKIILSLQVSLDGYIEGPNQEIDWHLVNEEYNEYAIDLLNTTNTILFGRVAHQLFEIDWPAAATNPSTSKSDLEIAHKIHNMTKIVFSKTLEKVEWKNSRLVREVISEEIIKMKQESGEDMTIGGAAIAQSFMEFCLIDEYRILVNPVWSWAVENHYLETSRTGLI